MGERVRASSILTLLIVAGSVSFACQRSEREQSATARSVQAEPPPRDTLLPGMPPPADSQNIYAAAGAGMLTPAAQGALARVYVPNGGAASVSVIDPATYRVVRTFATGVVPQHVVPAYDMQTLWVTNEGGNTLTPIDPVTGNPGRSIRVPDPYNLYFTPDGQYAIVVAERMRRLDFRDPHTMALHDSVPVACRGVDHMDFTADGRFAIASCEFSGELLKLDVATHKILGYLQLAANPVGHAMPQDVRSAPDGRVFYVADMTADGVHLLDPVAFKTIGFIPTGIGAHGVYPSRDGRWLYVTNRGSHSVMAGLHGAGSISVIDPATRTVVTTWRVPGGGSPDMGNVSADGKELWLSGRFDHEVYVFDTQTGALAHRIPVERGPHGLTVWPQPGRYSLGHTGNMR
jgi:YVTN family beta-propeller protein